MQAAQQHATQQQQQQQQHSSSAGSFAQQHRNTAQAFPSGGFDAAVQGSVDTSYDVWTDMDTNGVNNQPQVQTPPLCNCGPGKQGPCVATVSTSKSSKFKGESYWGCSRGFKEKGGCGFVSWCDPARISLIEAGAIKGAFWASNGGAPEPKSTAYAGSAASGFRIDHSSDIESLHSQHSLLLQQLISLQQQLNAFTSLIETRISAIESGLSGDNSAGPKRGRPSNASKMQQQLQQQQQQQQHVPAVVFPRTVGAQGGNNNAQHH